jgi:hypothetical protein
VGSINHINARIVAQQSSGEVDVQAGQVSQSRYVMVGSFYKNLNIARK